MPVLAAILAMRGAVAIALIVPLAGCLQLDAPAQSASDEVPWYLHGTFTQQRTQADVDGWCEIAKKYDNDCLLMESFPEQYRMRFPRESDCLAARGEILQIREARPGECRPEERLTIATPQQDPPRSPDGPVAWTTWEPPAARGPREATYDLDVVRVSWSDGGGRSHDMEWEVVDAWLSANGVVVIQTTTHGIEGGDFRFTLYLNAVEAPAVLAHAPGAPEEGTFDLTYTEAVFWAGRPVDTLVSVAPDSYARVIEMDERTKRLSGSFRIDFEGRCTTEFNCTDDDAVRRTVLDGSFGL